MRSRFRTLSIIACTLMLVGLLGAQKFLSPIDMGSNKITNLGTPSAGTDAVNLTYATNASNLASGTVPTARLGSGSASSSTFLRGDSTWATPGGLTNFTEGTGTYSSQTYVSLLPASGTNVNSVFGRKGTGYIAAQVPDGTSTGGGQRGTNAVDFQTSRSDSAGVASGTGAFIGAGSDNVGSGVYSVVPGGSFNQATATYATVGGGAINIASAQSATVPGGEQALADQKGEFAYATGKFNARGDAQLSMFVCRNQTTNNSATELFLDGSSGVLVIPNDTTWAFDVLVVARRTDANNESAQYHFSGCIDNNANTVALVSTVTSLSSKEDDSSWDCTCTADNSNKSLKINVTGATSKSINWVAHVRIVTTTG